MGDPFVLFSAEKWICHNMTILHDTQRQHGPIRQLFQYTHGLIMCYGIYIPEKAYEVCMKKKPSVLFRSMIFLAVIILMTGCAVTGSTLSSAAYKGQTDVVKNLLNRGANVNERSGCGFGWDPNVTALTCASHGGHMETVKVLVEKGADVNARSNDGWTPLISAAYKGHVDVAKFLIEKGADVDVSMAFLQRWPLGKDGLAFLENLVRKQRLSMGPEDPSSKLPQDTPSSLKPGVDARALPPIPDHAHSEAFDFGNYYALVIGNNDYRKIKKLHTAVSDAQAINALLQDKYGFKTRLLLNATRADILRAINDLRRRLGSRDNLLIYYAGHGWLDKAADQGYWLPVDATEQDPTNWISNGFITDSLRAMAAKHVLVIADSCYSGKLSRGVDIKLKTKDYYNKISAKKARTVMASGGLEPVADGGGKGTHSVFASALIEALNENQGVIDTTLLFSQIRRPVMVNSDQTPEYSDIRKAGHDGGDFLFVRADKP